MKKIMVFILSVLLMLGCFTVAVAAEDNSPDVDGSKEAEPTELTIDSRETTVTLSLPSAEYKNKVDIVFVMDNSTSMVNADLNIAENVQSLLNKIVEVNTGIELKVSVVKFRGFATDMLGNGLVVYDDSSSAAIVAAIANNEVPGKGSNIHSGLVLADKILEADAEVDNDHKYVVLLSDGKSYIWNNESNEPVQRYSQYLRGTANPPIQSGGKPVATQQAGNYDKELGTGVYVTVPGLDREIYRFGTVDASTSAYYQALYNSTDAELTQADVYDIPAYYTQYYTDYSGSGSPMDGTVTPVRPVNSDEVFPGSGYQKLYGTYYDFVPSGAFEGKKFLSINPYNITTDDNGDVIFDTTSPNEDFFLWHADTMQKGIFTAGHFWKETIDAKYNTAAIMHYKSGDGTGFALVGSYICWMLENSDFGARITDSDSVIKLFSDIDNTIRYMVDSGVVTDQITDDFELKEEGVPFTVETARDGKLTGTEIEAYHWGFGEKDDAGNYPYEVSYDKDNKTITWKINVPIENSNQLKLSYTLIIREDAETGPYDTNVSAVLDYKTSEGDDGAYVFPVPVVNYTAPEPETIDIDVTKVWDDKDDKDGIRPDSVTIDLLGDGEKVDSITLSAKNDWKGSFEGLLKEGENGEIKYTIKEASVKDYTSKVTGSAESGFIVTNVHTPKPAPLPPYIVPNTGVK